MDSRDDHRPPADPSGITLTYHHEHRWWYTADDAPERWHVSADIYDDNGAPGIHVGDIDIVLVDLYQTRDPFSLLDGESGDLGHIASTVFRPGSNDLDPDLDEQLEVFGGRLLILDRMQLTPQWRGFGLGVMLAGTALKKLSADARFAACYPARSTTPPAQRTNRPPRARQRAARRSLPSAAPRPVNVGDP